MRLPPLQMSLCLYQLGGKLTWLADFNSRHGRIEYIMAQNSIVEHGFDSPVFKTGYRGEKHGRQFLAVTFAWVHQQC
jgi:hypothetical protein